METIRACRFIRNVCTCVVIAGLLTDFKPAISWGVVVYFMTLAASQLAVEGFFLAAAEEHRKGGCNEQKTGGDVGRGDVPKAGS